jgi:hypothetical protein
MEVEIRPGALLATLTIAVVMLLPVLGFAVSPRDADGRPVLLLPDVRAVELYRCQVTSWVSNWTGVDESLNEVLSGDVTQLLALSRRAQRAFEQSAALAQDVDASESPPALLGLRDLSIQVAADYVGASVAVARWLSAPSPENRVAAEEAVAAAGEGLAAVQANEWVRERSSDQP